MSRLAPLFAPRGIAVVGASRDPGKLGAVMMRSLRSLRSFGGAGVAFQRDLAAAAADAGIALLGPNNPLRITRDGLVALDAVLRTRKDAQGGAR